MFDFSLINLGFTLQYFKSISATYLPTMAVHICFKFFGKNDKIIESTQR